MSASGSTDADAQTLTYAWDFGDSTAGSGVNVTHTYAAPGTYTVRVIVTDPLTLADTVTTTATVMTPAAAITDTRTLINQLETANKLPKGEAKSLTAKLDAALALLAQGNTVAAANQLVATRNQINSLVADGVLAAADAAPLLALINRVIDSIT
jgi:PKD repeat protein